MHSPVKRTNGIVDQLSTPCNQEGALSGRTFVVKDLFDLKGRVTGAGNPDWRRTHAQATSNALAVEALLNAGATLTGVSVSDEFAFSIDGINIHYGAPVNPQDPDRVAGGSSSGSASAVAAGAVDFALGTDTAGSIRVPASYCGIYGIRPSQGAISQKGVLPLSTSLDTVGWFARSPSTLKLVGQVLLGETKEQPLPSKLLVARQAFELVSQTLSDEINLVLQRLKEQFSSVEELDLSSLRWEIFPELLHQIRGWEASQFYGEWLDTVHPLLAPDIKARFDITRKVTKEQHDQSLATADELQEQFDKILGNDAVLCIPSTVNLAPKITSTAEELQHNRQQNLKLTAIASVARLPEISMPVQLRSGLRIGISLIANRNLDTGLLALNEALWRNQKLAPELG